MKVLICGIFATVPYGLCISNGAVVTIFSLFGQNCKGIHAFLRIMHFKFAKDSQILCKKGYLYSNAEFYVYAATAVYDYSNLNVSMFVCVRVCIIHGTIVNISTATSSCILCLLLARARLTVAEVANS